jgi:hypothetical protein
MVPVHRPPKFQGASRTKADDREYREYLREEQRSQTGCSAARMQMEWREALLVLRVHGPSVI